MLALEKIIASFFSLPGLFILLWLIITIYLLNRTRSSSIKILACFTMAFMYFSFTGLGINLFLSPLEEAYPLRDLTDYHQTYPIVVLGGGLNYFQGGERAELNPISLQRLVQGYKLATTLGSSIIYTGGVGLGYKKISEAEIAARWLKEMGFAEAKIIKEDRARTTYENGLYVKEWLKKNKKENIYLVTSAVHLSRSMRVFTKLGIKVIPISSGYLADHSLNWLDYLPNRSSLNANMAAIHEWLGIIYYKFKKWI